MHGEHGGWKFTCSESEKPEGRLYKVRVVIGALGRRGTRKRRDPVTVGVTGGEETSKQELWGSKKEKLGVGQPRRAQ